MDHAPLDVSANLAAERLAERRDRAEAARTEEPEPVLTVFSEEERGRVPAPPPVQPRRRVDPRKLKVKREKMVAKQITRGIGRPGKTARDKAKPRDDSRKTNRPELSQSMKGKGGGGGSKTPGKKAG